MINNFNILNPLITFDYSEPVVYQVQIIQRRKENPDLKKNAKIIKHYFLYNETDLSDLMPKIIKICNEKNARAYLNIEAKSLQSIGYHMQILTAKYMMNGSLNALENVFNRCYGGFDYDNDPYCDNQHSLKIKIIGPKRWVLDCDEVTIEYAQEVFEVIVDWHKEHKTNAEYPTLVQTPNGWHIISQGFHPKIVGEYDVEIKKNAPTILYAP